jgi:uncharacterized protein
MEEVISFKNKSNNELFGILHIPEKNNLAPGNIGINLLNPGLKNRVAPNRLNVKIARKLCKLGYYVLRFDPQGIGDSEGDFMGANEPVMDLWGAIQRGAFVDDTILSNEFLYSQKGVDKILLIGQCGAAVTAGIVGNRDNRVDRLILINTPFTLLSSDLKLINLIWESKSTKQLLNEYINDFIRFAWIKNLFPNGGINYPYLKEKIDYLKKAIVSRHQNNRDIQKRFNTALSDSLMEFMDRKKKIFFMFAGHDRSLNEFNTYFQIEFLQRNIRYSDFYSINIIEKANHIYTSIKSQEELIADICKSLDTYNF